MELINTVHDGYVHHRRIRRLGDLLSPLIPEGASVLDVGCGDRLLARRIQDMRPDLRVRGIDVLLRVETHIPVQHFDGRTFPEDVGQADVVMFVDTLHHTHDPLVLLREAGRVARQAILVKDNTRDGLLAGPTLRLMDYVGNAHHGVALR
jgi:SAM-dependent methyltransferase